MWTKEQELAVIFLRSVLDTSSNVDKLNTWMLAGAGATAGLLVSNLADISRATQAHVLPLVLAMLAVSALLGLIAKVNGIKAQNANMMFETLDGALANHPDTDVLHALKEYISAFPFWIRWSMSRGAEKGSKDPLHGYKRAANFAIHQSIYTTLQGIAFVVFIVIAATGIK